MESDSVLSIPFPLRGGWLNGDEKAQKKDAAQIKTIKTTIKKAVLCKMTLFKLPFLAEGFV